MDAILSRKEEEEGIHPIASATHAVVGRERTDQMDESHKKVTLRSDAKGTSDQVWQWATTQSEGMLLQPS